MSRLKKVREIVVCEVDFLLEHESREEESLADWTLLQKTLLKVAGDINDVVQEIKKERDEASVH